MATTPATLDELLRDPSWIRALALGLLREPSDADDAAQDTLVAALRHRPRAGARFAPWLVRTLRNQARKIHRSSSRRSEREERFASQRATTSPAEEARVARIREDVAEAVAALDEPYRGTVVAHYLEGHTSQEIAAREGLSEAAVRQRLKRGRDRMRSFLEERYGDEVDLRAALVWFVAFRPGAELAGLPWSTPLKISILATGALAPLVALFVLLPGEKATSTSVEPGEPMLAAAYVDPEPLPRDPVEPAARVSLPAEPSSPPPARGAARGALEVELRSADGRAYPDAHVLVQRIGAHLPYPETFRATTDAKGIAKLEELAEGTYWVAALRRSDKTDRVRVGAKGTTHHSIEIPAGFTVRGEVVDSDGYGIAGARIWVGEPWSRIRGQILATADEDGRFEVHDLKPNGMHWMGARADGKSPSSVTYFDANPGDVLEHVFKLPRDGGAVVGRVVDGKGRAVAGAELLLGYESADWACSNGGAPPQWGATEPDGTFRFDGAPAGHQALCVRAPGFAPAKITVGVEPLRDNAVVVDLVPEVRVSGTVRDERGRPVEGARIRTLPDETFTTARAWSDEKGRYGLTGVRAGSVVVEATLKKEGSARTWLDVAPGDRREWDARLGASPAVFGRVVDADGAPQAKYQLGLWEAGGWRRDTRYTFTDGDGDFEFEASSERPLVLVGYGDGSSFPELVVRDVLPSLDPLELRFESRERRGRVSGRVLGFDGRPAEAVQIGVEHVEQDFGHMVVADREGRFSFDAPLGTLRLNAQGEGHAWVDLGTWTLEAGVPLELGERLLDAAARVEGFVTGAPADGLEVEWVVAGRSIRANVGRDGFRSPPLAAGPATMVLQGVGVERVEVELELAAGRTTRSDVELRRAPTIELLLDPGLGVARPGSCSLELTDREGRVAWSSVGPLAPAGPLRLSASAPAGRYVARVETDTALAGQSEVVLSAEGVARARIELH